jgi:hypothetical protein
MRVRTQQHRTLQLDPLERRNLLDGAIIAQLIGANLFIDGDELANQIVIDTDRLGPGEVRVSVDPNATLNGGPDPLVFSEVRNIAVILLGGDDRLVLRAIDLRGHLTVESGAGADIVLIDRSTMRHKATVETASGNDTVHVVDSVLSKLAAIDTGAGSDIVALDGSQFQSHALVRTREGNDTIFLNSEFQGRRVIDAGSGSNLITDEAITREFDFRSGEQGWVAGFSDYPASREALFELTAGIRELPPELGVEGTGYFLSGNNQSDDLFMFLKRRLGPSDGLVPNQTYQLRVKLVLASNAPSDCFGVGGAPGESVHLKAGATAQEPAAVAAGPKDYLRMNVDKGDQASGGSAASVVGNIANGLPCDDFWEYRSLTRTHIHEFLVRTDKSGQLWILLGTDSGYESTTPLYYQHVGVTLIPIQDAPIRP